MFFLPLYDDNPSRPAYVTWMLIAACVAVFLWQSGLDPQAERLAALQYGMVPGLLFGHTELPPQYRAIDPWLSPLTSMFMHGGLLHLGGNMLFLWIFGNNVEEALGRLRYLVFYALCGYGAALFQAALDTASLVPMVGASGAIAGVLGAYALLYPKANVRTLVVVIVFFRIVTIPAAAILIGWFLMQTISGLQSAPHSGGGGVAYFAHVGGFVAGAALIFVMKRRGVQLFNPPRTTAFEITPITLPSQRRGRRGVPDSGTDPWDKPWTRR